MSVDFVDESCRHISQLKLQAFVGSIWSVFGRSDDDDIVLVVPGSKQCMVCVASVRKVTGVCGACQELLYFIDVRRRLAM